jgi:excisionase family DNA binding protein
VLALAPVANDAQLTRDEACRLLGVDYSTLYRYADRGQLTKLRSSSGRVRYCRRQIEELKARRECFVPVRQAC